jgi:hypothetical protein
MARINKRLATGTIDGFDTIGMLGTAIGVAEGGA